MTRAGVGAVFGEGGLLATTLGGYEERTQQSAMAEAVADAFADGSTVVIEAATGTGKTLAYLVPALQSGKRTIVSTATKTLQDQIWTKDIPLLRRVLPEPFDAVYLKGRQNYLCLWQAEQVAAAGPQRLEDRQWWPEIAAWAEETTTGDRGELRELPDDLPLWSDLSISGDACLGKECPHFENCFVFRARERAAKADLIIVNHHLFFADLALRERTNATLLPEWDALIFDEAHHLEEIAANFFGMNLSNYRVEELVGDLHRWLIGENLKSVAVVEALDEAKDASLRFFGALAEALGTQDRRETLAEVWQGAAAETLEARSATLIAKLHRVQSAVLGLGTVGEAGLRMADRAESVAIELYALTEERPEGFVYVCERRGRGTFLQAWPIDLTTTFRQVLFPSCGPQVYTSATLATDGNFAFFRQRMGMGSAARELCLPPVFDYMEQALLFVPRGLPTPTDPQFVEGIAPVMKALIDTTEGRAFLLFTSYRNMHRAHELLAPTLDMQVLLQGQRSRNALLEAFREDTHSVLFATASFWEGVDVQGDALSLVIIDKLPFASPQDPLLQARMQHLQGRGLNPFAHYQVPAAMISLKQGFGRLIRHRDDRGIIAILDDRIISRGYGKRFLASLPRARRTRDIETVGRWWAHQRAQTEGSPPGDDESPTDPCA